MDVDQSAKNVGMFQNILDSSLLWDFSSYVAEKYIILESDITSMDNRFHKFQK
jgi:hypothetical protein